jgi:hypothetical protein
MAVFGADSGDGAGIGAGLDAGGVLFDVSAAGWGLGEHAAISATPTKGVISMKRLREVDNVIKVSCGNSDNLPWVAGKTN